jgi:ABC-type branched-subunit amino acid transport system substrate-binding protein
VLCTLLVTAGCSVTTPRDGFSQAVATDGQPPGAGGGVAGGLRAGEIGGAAVADSTVGASDASEVPGSVGDTRTGGAGPAGGTGSGLANGSTTVPAGGGGPVVGVSKDTITISAIAGFSGSYGVILNKIYENGFLVWVQEVNDAGGINGRRVISKKVDNKDTAEGGVAACKEIQNNGSFLAVSMVGFGGADVSAADCLDRAGVTTLAFNLSSFNPRWRNVFSAGDPGKQTRPMASFIKNVIGETKNVGIIAVNDPLYAATKAALVDELPKEGLKVVRVETTAPNQGSFVAELSRVRSAGATTVALLLNTAEIVGALRDAKAISYQPKWTGSYGFTDENTTVAPSLYEGIHVIRNYASTNSPVYPHYVATARKQGKNDVVNATTMALYGMGLTVGQALRNAGPGPTAGSLVGGIESLVNYNNGITMKLSFGRGVRVAEVGMWPLVCCNPDNTWRGIGEPRSRF